MSLCTIATHFLLLYLWKLDVIIWSARFMHLHARRNVYFIVISLVWIFGRCSDKLALMDLEALPSESEPNLRSTESTAGYVRHSWTECWSGHSWQLHSLRFSTLFEMKKGSQGMQARLVANGKEKKWNKNRVIGTQRLIHLLTGPVVKSKHMEQDGHRASSSHTVGQTHRTEITRLLRGWRRLRVTQGAKHK